MPWNRTTFWGNMCLIPDRGWCYEESQSRKRALDQCEQRVGYGGGWWGRVSPEVTLVGKDSRQGSSQCYSPRARKRSHASGCRQKHRGRWRRMDGPWKPQGPCPCTGTWNLPGWHGTTVQLSAASGMFSVPRRCFSSFLGRDSSGESLQRSFHRQMREDSGLVKDAWESGCEEWQPIPVLLPGKSQGQWSLVGCRLWGHRESDTTEAS